MFTMMNVLMSMCAMMTLVAAVVMATEMVNVTATTTSACSAAAGACSGTAIPEDRRAFPVAAPCSAKARQSKPLGSEAIRAPLLRRRVGVISSFTSSRLSPFSKPKPLCAANDWRGPWVLQEGPRHPRFHRHVGI